MYAVRLWSVRHARGLNAFYRGFESVLVRMQRVLRAVGHERLERPVAGIEKAVKGLLFDCRMCGQCVLSSTGMSCPMNCPKSLRNGPCGGVRADGNCEVKPQMRCVWVEAYRGSERIPGGGAAMSTVQFAVDQRMQGRSSWLRVVREILFFRPARRGTDITQALEFANRMSGRRSVQFLISDFQTPGITTDSRSPLRRALSQAARRRADIAGEAKALPHDGLNFDLQAQKAGEGLGRLQRTRIGRGDDPGDRFPCELPRGVFGLVMAILGQASVLDARIAAGCSEVQIELALAMTQQDHAICLTRLAARRQPRRWSHDEQMAGLVCVRPEPRLFVGP